MRLVSYNIHKAIGLDGRRDPHRILRVLRQIDGDVVVLQEVDLRLGKRPSALPPEMILNETDYRIVDHAGSDVSLGWHGNAVLVKRGVEAEALDRLHLPGLEPRGAILAQCGGLIVAGTHLGLLRASRAAQMARIREAIAAHDQSRSVVAGDFNEWSLKRGFEPWNSHFEVIRPGRSFHARRQLARLDGFAMGPAVKVRDAGMFDKGEARIASDHLPVWVEVEPLKLSAQAPKDVVQK